jgi:hypothetical protein
VSHEKDLLVPKDVDISHNANRSFLKAIVIAAKGNKMMQYRGLTSKLE